MNTRFPIQETSQQTILYYVLFFVLLFLFQNCSTEVQFDKIDPPIPINKSLSSILIKDCSFNGSVISHESRVNAFLESAVPYGQLCSSQERVCNNGTLSGSFAYASCSSGSPQACLFDGKTIHHGGKIKAYLTSAVSYGQLCSSQEEERVCNNGTLSGSFAYASCSSGSPQACLFDGKTIPHGGKINAYLTSAVPYGQLCSSQERVCNNGTLSGSFAYASCNQPIANPSGCGTSHLNTFSNPPTSGLCNLGSASTVSWTTNGNHGVFNWTCGNDHCRAFSPDCPSSMTWTVGQFSCSGSNGGVTTNYFSVNNPYPGNKGSATYSCSMQGSWTGPTSATCEQNTPQRCRLPTTFIWGSCQADTNAQDTKYSHNSTYTLSDTTAGNWLGPGTGSSTWKCNNGNWTIINATCSP